MLDTLLNQTSKACFLGAQSYMEGKGHYLEFELAALLAMNCRGNAPGDSYWKLVVG